MRGICRLRGQLEVAGHADVAALHDQAAVDSRQPLEVVEGRADAVSIQLPPGTNGLDRVVRALDEAGVAVEDIALRAPTLDDVFLAKTGRTLEGAASTSGEVAA